MKGISFIRPESLFTNLNLCLALLLTLVAAARAQNANDEARLQRRVARARALAAAGNLPAARSELESLKQSADESVKEIALVLLVGVYFDQSDYTYAENLVNEAFRARAPQNESAARRYFLLAGQAIHGVEAHLERYRAFGLGVGDEGLPPEARRDLDSLRGLIERLIAQARQLRDEGGRSVDALALIEEAASLRARLARSEAERAQWQREVAEARQRLIGGDGRGAVAAPKTATPPATQTSAQAAPAAGQTAAPAEAANTTAQPSPSPTPANSGGSPTAGTSAGASGATSASEQPAVRPGGQSSGATAERGAGGAAAGKPVEAGQPVEVGSLLPMVKKRVDPAYPQTARQARVSGQVTVYLTVDEKGQVAAVQRTEGPDLLRRAAEDAARRWRFHPTLVNNQPARITGHIVFNFSL